MVGGCRNAEDAARVQELKKIAEDIDLTRSVMFLVNAPYETVQQYLASSSVGLHTMRDEHFGISVVEFLAAGLIAVANDSAGPKQDIVVPAFPRGGKKYRMEAEGAEKATGFLAGTIDEYVEALQFIFSHEEQLEGIRANGRERSKMFSTEKFVKTFKEKLIAMLNWGVC
ncbi:uncharacterized protein [Blastocystis hominis]|uniref:Glycosyl transferase family 1 domain-containing protein n=1 Tax=Blastocystis hominis TaxID=12968 RepID=D8M0N5_BLAHO|nr:uncharacterized protein [Blastocystis hominis]CBK21624.2 unnamed protein product [Blastocystis hominis]|eukprot:XP_012895672.1 uncharacterized protein [Blastocystis hominis]